jgi:hypothetical protein
MKWTKLWFVSLLSAGVALPQSFTGSITGTVRDATGAAVPGVQITVVNVNTNEIRRTESGAVGGYTLPALPPGTYRLEAKRTGFKGFSRPNIIVSVNQQIAIDIALEVGEITQSVEVTAETPLLQATTSSLGQVVDNRRILDLPLVGRNTLALIGLTAGAQPVGQFGGIPSRTNAYNQGFFSTSGSQVLTNETLVDGVPANAAVFNAPAFVPVPEAVQEFKVQTNNFSAEFGRTGGGVINIVMRSGDNQMRGSLYEFFRAENLDANNWFNNRAGRAKPHNVLNQFGGTAGGPIYVPRVYNGRDKSFWFFNYEGLRDRRGLTQLFTVPTVEQLNGDFSRTVNASGQLITIADPFTTARDASGQFVRQPFANNRIPASMFDPVAANVRRFWPPPNTIGTATGANNFIGNGSAPNTQDQVTVRVDHTIRQAHKLFGRFSWSNVERGAVDFFGNGAGWVNPGGGGVPLVFNARNAALEYTWTASPTVLANIRYGFVRQFVGKTPALTGIDLTTLGFPAALNDQVPLRALPAFQPSGFRAIAPATADLIRRADNTHSLQGNLTKVTARHTLKVGVDGRYIPIGELQPSAPQGVFNFDGRFTSTDPLRLLPNSGHSIAAFLLGLPSSGSIDYNPAISISHRYFSWYVQDDIRVTHQLTLNLGVRYELETGRNERYNRLSWFDPSAPHPLAQATGISGLRGGLRFVGVDGNPRRQNELDKNNFGPRFGFAYKLSSRTVLRGGYGLFYLPLTGDDTGRNLGAEGFFAATTFVSSLDGGITPADRLSNPFPRGLSQPLGSSQGLSTLIGQDIITVLRTNRSAYAQEWNFNIQQELPGNLLVDVAYAGNKGTKLPINVNLNQLPDQYLSLGSGLLAQVRNPFAPFISVGPLSAATVAQGQLLRPFPQFTNINARAIRAGSSIYHSAQFKAERRFSRGFSLLGAYTVSKMITDATSRLAINFSNPGYQNNNNLRLERSLGNVDIPQRLVVSYNFELPFGPGKALLGAGGVAGKIFGGWQVNGITTIQSGPPLGLSTSANQTNSFGGGSRPNNNGTSAKITEGSTVDRLNRYFDTSVFSQPAPFTFGNVARTLPDVREPGLVNFDFSVIKNTRVNERASVQFRAEFFNLLNNTNFGPPGTTFGTPTFGVIGSAADARIIQLGMKLLF